MSASFHEELRKWLIVCSPLGPSHSIPEVGFGDVAGSLLGLLVECIELEGGGRGEEVGGGRRWEEGGGRGEGRRWEEGGGGRREEVGGGRREGRGEEVGRGRREGKKERGRETRGEKGDSREGNREELLYKSNMYL